jgi:hypothetical protein
MIGLPYLLMITMILSSGGEETGEWVIPAAAFHVTPSPAATPVPSPSPRIMKLGFYFRQPAKIIPIHNREGEFEIVQEKPWLTEDDINRISPSVDEDPMRLSLYLKSQGNMKYRAAMMGNVGRTIVFSLDGTSRYTTKMVPVARKDRIRIYGDFSREEALKIADQINNRPAPTPTPVPTPSPSRRQRFIIK